MKKVDGLGRRAYDVSPTFFEAPKTFSMAIGSGGTSRDLMRAVTLGTRFTLRIGGVVQFMGVTGALPKKS